MRHVLVFTALSLAVGCGDSDKNLPVDVAALSKAAVDSRDDARAARAAGHPDKAAEHAARSEAAVARLIKALGPSQEKADHELKRTAEAAASEARYYAELAEEEKQRADALASWKARIYKTARVTAVQTTTRSLIAAAEEAGRHDPESLPEQLQVSAEIAADMANQLTGRQPLANGQPDWKGIVKDLKAMNKDISQHTSQFLALTHLISGQPKFALYEIEMVDPQNQKTHDEQLYFHLLKGTVYSMNDWQHLAVLEVENISTDGEESSEELMASVHLMLAYLFLRGNDLERADRETVRAMQIWPNNPVSVFLTGERLAASGEHEKAADSLEKHAKTSRQKWFAKRVSQRARALRDTPGKGQTLIHDSAFMREVVLNYFLVAAEESPAAARIKRQMDSAVNFGNRLLKHLPGNRDAQD